MDLFVRLLSALGESEVRYVVIGVWGANYYARSSSTLFSTHDRDLFLPLDADNLLKAFETCRSLGFKLSANDEPLEEPLDASLAKSIVNHNANVTASHASGLDVDFVLTMAGHDFELVSSQKREFRVENIVIPVAKLSHIVASKAAINREKDRLFLKTHEDALRMLLKEDEN